MPSTIRSFDELRVDIIQAVKRAIMRRGVLPIPDKPAAATKHKARSRQSSSSSDSDETQEKIDTEAPAEVKEKHGPAEPATEPEVGPEKLLELDERTHDILFETSTVFPFTLFPDTVTLDREKLTIAERFFWRVAKITTVPVSEVLTCNANVGPFFGSLHLVFSFFADNQRDIKFLKREDANNLHRMLQGYIIAHKRGINTINVSVEDLKILLKDLGQGASD